MDAVDVVVFEANLGALEGLEGRYPLPLRIGRGGNADLRLQSQDGSVSRVHATVSLRGGTLVLADTSTNGTRYHGRLLKNAEVAINDRDEFSLQEYRIRVLRVPAVVKAPPAAAKAPPAAAKAPPVAAQPPLFHAVVQSRSRELTYAVGQTFLVLLLQDDRPILEVVRPKDPASILAANAAEGRDVMAVFAARDGAGIIVTTPAAVARRLLINRGLCRGDTEPLRPLDVVTLGRLRIEMLEHERRALRCKNVECELLNPYEADENCRFCGHRLVEAQTRVVTG